jgi:protein-tyrosine phosphatase
MVVTGKVVVVCTGNVCRSPYIERRLRQELSGTAISVVSAGTKALVGRDMDAATRTLLDEAGADTGRFTARTLTEEMVGSADLVVTAAREHRGAAVRLCPTALNRVLTLRDLADLLDGVSPGHVVSSGGSANWVRQVADAAMARRAHVPARQNSVDITDPIGAGPVVFERMAAEIESALSPVVAVLKGP